MRFKLSMARTLKTLCSIMPLVALSTGASAADRFAKVEIKAQQIRDHVYMLTGSGGNIGVSIGNDATMIIDDQFAPLSEKILAALQKLGGGRPAMILNTHLHGDHTGGNPFFGQTGTIIAHDNVRQRLAAQGQLPTIGLPKITYQQQLQLHINDERVRVRHMPAGHTDGDSVVLFENANVVHMGDHFFNGAFPYIDIANGGSVNGFVRNMRELLATLPQDVLIIPGHGQMGNVDDLRSALETIETTQAIINSGINEQLSDAQIAENLRAYNSWGQGFISIQRWIDIIRADRQAYPSAS